jgi:hypothetical protein
MTKPVLMALLFVFSVVVRSPFRGMHALYVGSGFYSAERWDGLASLLIR